MTATEKGKLNAVFNMLSEEEKVRDIVNLPYDRFQSVLNEKDTINIEISDKIQNLSMFTGYSGRMNLLRITKGEVIMKPKFMKELL